MNLLHKLRGKTILMLTAAVLAGGGVGLPFTPAAYAAAEPPGLPFTPTAYAAAEPPDLPFTPTAYAAAEPHSRLDAREAERFADEFFHRPDIQENMAGAVIVLVKDGQVLLQKGYGYADIGNKVPADPDKTVFRVASVSKVITATAVMQLAEQGKLDLNRDLSAYMGEVRLPNRTDTPLTMRHLLTNATGFDYGDTPESSTTDLTREAPLKQYVKDNAPTVVRKPGEYFRYDNLGFTIQGYVVEQVSGQPFGEYVADHIFKPLGMTGSGFRLTEPLMKNLAVPYNIVGEPIPAFATVPTELPGGGMLSTGSDMARFMMAHLDGGKLGSARILKEESVKEMQKPQLAIHPKLPNMGYGFEYSNRQTYNGREVVEKSGDVEGYHTGMWLLPEERAGLFVTVNRDVEIRLPLFEAFMDRYYPGGGRPEGAPAAAEPGSLARFEGTYSDLRNRMWTTRIRAEAGSLIVKDPLGEHVLRQAEPLLFRDEQGVEAAFKLNGDAVEAFYYDLKSDSWAEKMPEPPRYRDVPDAHPYAPYIDHLRQLHVIQEESGENMFQPDRPVTREQFVGWLMRWAGIAPSNRTPIFRDAAASGYAKEIQAAYEFGLIQGTEDGRFAPQEPILRQEAAMLVWRMAFGYLHAKPMEAAAYEDMDVWAREGVRYVIAKSLYGPEVEQEHDGAVRYHSRDPMLKQEAAALLSRFADNLF